MALGLYAVIQNPTRANPSCAALIAVPMGKARKPQPSALDAENDAAGEA